MSSLINKLKAGVEKQGNPQGSNPAWVRPNVAKPRPNNDLGLILMEQIDRHLDSKGKTKFVQKTGFSPSNTINCSRRMVYLFRGVDVEKDIDARTQRIFDNGHSFHERTVKYFAELGILAAEEYEVWLSDPPIHAFIDAILNLNGPVIAELKSIGDVGFENRIKYGQPKADHTMQIQLYMHITGVRRGIVYYENKNDQRVICFQVDYDSELVERELAKHRKTLEAYRDGTLPKRPARSPESAICKYCDLKAMCWAGFPNNLAP